MNIEEAFLSLEPVATTIENKEALATIYLMAIGRYESLRQSEEEHEKLQVLTARLKDLNK